MFLHATLSSVFTCLFLSLILLQYLSNAALSYTSVASTTVLSATSGLFTLLFGVILGEDSINVAKVVAVFVSLAGVIMTTLGKTWAADESELNSSLYVFNLFCCYNFYNLNRPCSYQVYFVLYKNWNGQVILFGLRSLFVFLVFGSTSNFWRVSFKTSYYCWKSSWSILFIGKFS